MVTRTQAVKKYLAAKAPIDLASLYSPDMECQVLVAQDGGERVEGEYKGHAWSAWTDGSQTWKNFRIPLHANTKPEYEDREIKFDLEVHADGIGMTGWDWKHLKSRWVAYDFDAIMGHSDKHEQKLSDTQLQEVQDAACKIPWVTVRRSTSGNGLHLYVFVDGVDTENHNEHAALARAILSKMSAITGFDFDSRVDNCGGNIWIWHRKFERAGGRTGPGLKLIKQGEVISDIPPNWRDHIKVASGQSKRTAPGFVGTGEISSFEEFCGMQTVTPLDDEHKKLFAYLDEVGAMWWFNTDLHMLVCHTSDLKKAHDQLSMRGVFETASLGREHGVDQNCYAFPLRRGAWVVRRHTPGVHEHESWDQDASGWTRCYLNKEPDLKTAARFNGATENEKGGFIFKEAEIAGKAAQELGAAIDIPALINTRPAMLKPHKDGRLVITVDRQANDPSDKMNGWTEEKGKWVRILNIRTQPQEESDVGNYEDMVRHIVSQGSQDAGWVIKSDGTWNLERLEHVKAVLLSTGLKPRDMSAVLGNSILKKWKLVNKPFASEYPGDREWNRNAAQLAYTPSQDVDNLHYPTWNQLLKHAGTGLDEAVLANNWCRESSIKTGGEYLRCWVASMIQHPMKNLPYLFFYSEAQVTGKSTFHQAIRILMKRGAADAGTALLNPQGFNSEIESAVLCYIEEVDLRATKSSIAYNRIKNWVTADEILIHPKGKTPYLLPNTSHWIQCGNRVEYCPVFPGDTRITMIHVPTFQPNEYIEKEELLSRLQKEAPDFLAAILKLELPYCSDRLGIPVLNTEDKKQVQKTHQNELESFLEECTFPAPGQHIKFSEFYDRFLEWLDPIAVQNWSKIKMGRLMPMQFPKGRIAADAGQFYFGNLSWTVPTEQSTQKYALQGQMLVLQNL